MVQSLYSLDNDDIKGLTPKEFWIKAKNIGDVAKLYNPYIGDDKESKKEGAGVIDELINNVRKKKNKKQKTKNKPKTRGVNNYGC
jgi:hypothetical protein